MPENLSKPIICSRAREGFQVLDQYERLIQLRADSLKDFLLRTSEATRRALAVYEEQKARQTEHESE